MIRYDTSMFVLLIFGQKCTLAASRADPRWVTCVFAVRAIKVRKKWDRLSQTGGETDRRTPDRYITLRRWKARSPIVSSDERTFAYSSVTAVARAYARVTAAVRTLLEMRPQLVLTTIIISWPICPNSQTKQHRRTCSQGNNAKAKFWTWRSLSQHVDWLILGAFFFSRRDYTGATRDDLDEFNLVRR